ncbi:MAG: MarC family protein [Spirochaetota bacterium]
MHISFIISIFFTLFIAVDPFGLIPIFIIFITKYDAAERRRIIFKAIITSIVVSVFFIFLGRFILLYLGISQEAFLISGGILLFLISMDLILARPSRTKIMHDNIEDVEKEDVSVSPLAIPMISGPGTIAALMMFSSQVKDEPYMLIIITLIAFFVLLITMIVMFLSSHIEKVLGRTGISVIQRIMGLILSALAVQFIVNGIKQIF